jgi:hypothetical protein
METISAYILSAVVSMSYLLVSIIVAFIIPFEGGSHPRDPKKRRTWFWVFAALTPITNFLLGYFVFIPDANIMVLAEFTKALYIGTGLSLVAYLLSGLILSRIFVNGKIGNWF